MRTPSAGASGVIIETERLRIRAHRDDDLADLMALAGNWEIARWVGTIPHPYSEADGREWITRVQENHSTGRPRRFAIALKETDRLIGGVGLDVSTGDCAGVLVGPTRLGKRDGREAAAAVIDYGSGPSALKTIRAYTDPGNTASQKVLLHCGLKKRRRDRTAHADTPRGTARAVIPRLSAGAFSMNSSLVPLTAGADTRRCRRRASRCASSKPSRPTCATRIRTGPMFKL